MNPGVQAPMTEWPRVNLKPKFLTILKEVSQKHEVSIQDIKGSDMSKTTVLARREAMYRLSKEAGLSNAEIARILCRESPERIKDGVLTYQRYLLTGFPA